MSRVHVLNCITFNNTDEKNNEILNEDLKINEIFLLNILHTM